MLYRNCTHAYEEWRARGRKEGIERERKDLIEAMARNMRRPGEDIALVIDRVRKQLDAYWPAPKDGQPPPRPRQPWRMNYLEEFAGVVSVPVTQLTHPGYGAGKVDEASHAAFLAKVAVSRLTPDQVRRLAANVRQTADRPGLFDLVREIVDALLSTDDAREAERLVGDLIRKRPEVLGYPQQKRRRGPRKKNPK
ncbi:MAG: hypothetical protein ACQGVC_18100 [Myxococcota bacterium]